MNIHWYPEIKTPEGPVLYDMVELVDEERSEWFMLEFAGERSRNSAAMRLRARRIVVGDCYKLEAPSLAEYVRLKALQWLESRSEHPWSRPGRRGPTGELVEELRRFREELSRFAPVSC